MCFKSFESVQTTRVPGLYVVSDDFSLSNLFEPLVDKDFKDFKVFSHEQNQDYKVISGDFDML